MTEKKPYDKYLIMKLPNEDKELLYTALDEKGWTYAHFVRRAAKEILKIDMVSRHAERRKPSKD